MIPATRNLLTFLDGIESSAELPRPIRVQARRLKSEVVSRPGHVTAKIGAMAAGYRATASYAEPENDLWRCVPVATVHEHMVSVRWRTVDLRAFLSRVAGDHDPVTFLRANISPGTTVFPAAHSWLVEADSGIAAMTSRALRAALQLRADARPPLILFRLSVGDMVAQGVAVRAPNALDAAAGGHAQWDPVGLRIGREYVDRDVPIDAVTDILWKP